jgi:hypothetical protein
LPADQASPDVPVERALLICNLIGRRQFLLLGPHTASTTSRYCACRSSTTRRISRPCTSSRDGRVRPRERPVPSGPHNAAGRYPSASPGRRAKVNRCGHIAVTTQVELDSFARFIDCPTQVHPHAFHIYIRLITPPRTTHGPGVAVPAICEFQRVMLHPPQNARACQIDAPLAHHCHQIAITQL